MISAVTDAVVAEVTAWQSRPLEPLYPVVFFDALRVKIRDEGLVRNRPFIWRWPSSPAARGPESIRHPLRRSLHEGARLMTYTLAAAASGRERPAATAAKIKTASHTDFRTVPADMLLHPRLRHPPPNPGTSEPEPRNKNLGTSEPERLPERRNPGTT